MKRNRYPKENYKMNYGKCWTAMSKGLAVAAVTMGLAAGSLANQGPRVLITTPINEAQLLTLVGNTRFDANAHTDRGRVADSFQLQHMLLQLRRPAELEDAFAKYIETQTDKSSPNFRHWMSAKEQGETFGLAQQDIDAITDWLRSKGFAVGYVYPSRMVIDFSGTAGQVRDAFHTEIHNLDVKGEKHIANMSAPQIPAALAPVVAGIRSLHDFFPKPTMHVTGVAKRDPRTGTLSVFEQAGNPPSLSKAIAGKTPGPLLTYTSNGEELVGPQDFYTIYNEKTLLTGTACAGAACNGAGQTIAVIEETDVCNGQSGTTPDDCNGANDLT